MLVTEGGLLREETSLYVGFSTRRESPTLKIISNAYKIQTTMMEKIIMEQFSINKEIPW